jgi:hypothetical protein
VASGATASISTPSASVSGGSRSGFGSGSASAWTPPTQPGESTYPSPNAMPLNSNGKLGETISGGGVGTGLENGLESSTMAGFDLNFGIDTTDWFDIASFSFDVDTLDIPEGSTFEANQFSFGM